MSLHSDSEDGLLGESTYEILTDSPVHSDDDDDLSSLASLAEDEADIESEDYDENEDEEDEDDDDDELPDNSSKERLSLKENKSQSQVDLLQDVPDTVDTTGIPSYSGLDQHETPECPVASDEDSFTDGTILFNEPISSPEEYVSVSHELYQFSQEEIQDLSITLPLDTTTPQTLQACIRSTISQKHLSVKDTFRVLYVGDETTKEDIITKLGAALVVESTMSGDIEDSKSSARFNVVPVTSFGNTLASPEVELVESFGLEMALDTCTSASSVGNDKGGDTITLLLKPRTTVRSIWSPSGSRLSAPGWRLPHIAIIYCSSNDDKEARQTRSYVRAFVARHGIPVITISDKKLYNSIEEFQVNPMSVHISVESQFTDLDGERAAQIFKELPIDLQSFLNLDVQQLSRNLAVIVKQDDDTVESLHNNKDDIPLSLKQVATDLFEKLQSSQNFTLFAGLGLLLLLGMFGIFTSSSFLRFPSHSSIQQSVSISTPVTKGITTLPPIKVSLSPTFKVVTTSSTTTPSLLSTSKSTKTPTVKPSTSSISLASSKSTSTLLPSVLPTETPSLSITDLPILKANETNEFNLYTISDGNIVLRSPQKFAALKKPPSLLVHIRRRNTTIPVVVTKLFRGVYALKLDQKDAWGSLNITVQTASKPIYKQNFNLDLGNRWFSKLAWKQFVVAASSDLKKSVATAGIRAQLYAHKAHSKVQNIKIRKIKTPKVTFINEDRVKFAKDKINSAKNTAKSVKIKAKHAQKVVANGVQHMGIVMEQLSIKLHDLYSNAKPSKEEAQEKVGKAQRNALRLWRSGKRRRSTSSSTSSKSKGCGKRRSKWSFSRNKKFGKCKLGR